ncbi:MAG TPA: ribonuclease D [Gammaproteobacteria bacterium]|nr:ribonuclease D [Gammaproteobacteria bacterium]
MSDDSSSLWIATADDLDALCKRLRTAAWLALDTEFMRERSYFPKLCLIQLATPELVACVDPLAVTDLSPLLDVLYDTHITKVLHAARQDLEILFNLAQRVPTPVFDTQLAASFAGFPDQVGYATLVEQLTGVHLDKGHTRADWSRRPLSEGAQRYAADDVRYLRDVYLKLHAELARRERLTWMERERATLEDPATYRNDPELAWRRLRGAQRLKPRQLAAAKTLAAWREQRAMDEDLPRQWVLKDELLYDLARQQPASIEALREMRGVNDALLRKYGEAWLTLLRDAPAATPGAAPAARLDAEDEALVDALSAVLRLKSAAGEVSAAQLATRAEIEKLVRGERSLAVLSGWRLDAVGRDLLRLLDGEIALVVRDHRLMLEPISKLSNRSC